MSEGSGPNATTKDGIRAAENGRTRPILALVIVNTIVFIVLLGALNLASALLLSKVLTTKTALAGGAESPAYAGHEERMRIFFREYELLRSEYRDFVGWHHQPFEGETINIGADGERSVGVTSPADHAPVARFFGGSTIWGTGAVDSETIPAFFAIPHPDMQVHNHGEIAYVARQGLVEMIEILSQGKSADLVVFYDGVNDVATLCRREMKIPGMSRRLTGIDSTAHRSGFGEVWGAIDTLLFSYTVRLISQLQGGNGLFDCSTDAAKANRVAAHLVGTWQVAHDLVTARGGRFIGLLQPVAYLGEAATEHIALDLESRGLGAEYAAVYPLIREHMRPYPYLYDLSDAVDGDQILYSDWAHLNGTGNEIMAGRIDALVQEYAADKRAPEP